MLGRNAERIVRFNGITYVVRKRRLRSNRHVIDTTVTAFLPIPGSWEAARWWWTR